MMVSKKGSLLSIWTENASIQTKNYLAALSIMTSKVFGSLVRQVWPPCRIKLDIWKFLQVLAGRTKCSGGP